MHYSDVIMSVMAFHITGISIQCLLNLLFRRRSKKTSKFHVTGLCEGNPTVTGGFHSQTASNMENVSIWWRHHGQVITGTRISMITQFADVNNIEEHNSSNNRWTMAQKPSACTMWAPAITKTKSYDYILNILLSNKMEKKVFEDKGLLCTENIKKN